MYTCVTNCSADPRAPRNTRFPERQWLKVQLINMLLRLVKGADSARLAIFCASFEPMWFVLMFQQTTHLAPSMALLQLLTVLLGENENYCRTFRRANAFVLIGARLERFHTSADLYLGLFRVMFAAHLKSTVSPQGCTFLNMYVYCIYLHVCLYVCLYACMYICVYAALGCTIAQGCIYTCTNTCIHTFIQAHVDTSIHSYGCRAALQHR